MTKLRYSEAFYSVQGEGRFVGVPSVFLRTFGCNFRCMNFGLAKEPNRAEKLKQGIKYNPEVKELLDAGITDKVEKFEENCSDNTLTFKNTYQVDTQGVVRKSLQYHSQTLGSVKIERLDR